MSDVDVVMPAAMRIKNDEGQIIGEGIIDMHGMLHVNLDFSHEANEFLQFAKLSDRYDLKFSLMLGFEPAKPYVKGKLQDE